MFRSMSAAGKLPAFAAFCFFFCAFQPSVAWSANSPPSISGTPRDSVIIGNAYGFTPTASDPNGQTLTFRIANKPAWATFSTSTGRLSGAPKAANAGTYSSIVITVSDGVASTSLPAFSIKVVPNSVPVISGTPGSTATVGATYAFTPKASDANGQALKYSIANKPGWATFSTSTGRLSGTPKSTHIGTYSGIVISVSDGIATTSLPSFALKVATATSGTTNRAPVISGTPVTRAAKDQPYSFRPTVTDADGDPLTFSIANKPAWASFDTSSGTLYGTPGVTGTFSNIVISVSDGTASASLPAFGIVVSTAATTSVTVSWVPPTKNTDGTPVKLSGYRIHYGMAPGQYSSSLTVSGATITSAVLQGLTAGQTWYFAVKAVATTGAESVFTKEVSKAL
jgi:Putative Ig domain/Fibronectin type III domain